MKSFFTCWVVLFLVLSACSKDDRPDEAEERVSDAELITRVQKEVFSYFWDYAHPTSQLARERLHEADISFDMHTVATGGSGFGLLNLILGIENQFISRSEGIYHLESALHFLEQADRFHGAWPHWMDGQRGTVIPFSALDNGGDLVETAFLCQSLICIREYFKEGNAREVRLAQLADRLWRGVEWDWYTRGEEVLYWHWSPDHDWQMNLPIRGYNEALVTYILAAASPTHPVSPEVYHNGWARNGAILNGASNYAIPVIFDHSGATGHVGPLFWAHYSYLALDPRGLSDSYADYWEVVTNHTNIVYQHGLDNPIGYEGYGASCWGLTASYTRNDDGSVGYAAHQPMNDRGVITPTAALSSIPYTPSKSIDFLRFLYEESQSDYIGIAGPYDAFSVHYQWRTQRYLAIDQGTIGPMMENYKTQLFWNLFMQAPEIQQGLITLGFSSAQHGF